jgi:hypothetical protein
MFLPNNPPFDPGFAARVRRETPRPSWALGLDLGQRLDFSALATAQLTWAEHGRCPVSWEIRRVPTLSLLALDRFPLGTDYEEIPAMLAARADMIDASPRAYHPANPAKHTVIDGGGPGAPVVDRVRRQLGQRLNIKPVIITGGKLESHLPKGYSGVPRRTLISNTLLMLSNGSLKVPSSLDLREELEKEFAALSAGGSHQPAGAKHDDLVIAVALAVWGALQSAPELLPDRRLANYEVWDAAKERTVPPPPPEPPKRKTRRQAK